MICPDSWVSMTWSASSKPMGRRRHAGACSTSTMCCSCLSGVLAEYPAIAAEIREQYRHFVVDEFQDVSPLQFDVLSRWLGPRDNLCVVGDPAQTIYSFAGADASLLGSLGTAMPEAENGPAGAQLQVFAVDRDHSEQSAPVHGKDRLDPACPTMPRQAPEHGRIPERRSRGERCRPSDLG